nr:retrovirus-related Pol polyprotein from transposon TNT 1-94 [Tanacetum cinerariifolium]
MGSVKKKNRVLVVKPHFKTPYELFRGRTFALTFMRPFGCQFTILNTLDHLGKFDGKLDERFFVGYSTNSKAFRVYNTRTRNVEENLYINFLEYKPRIVVNGPKWLFDIDAQTKSMNYVPIIAGTNSNVFAKKGASFDAGQSSMETRPSQDYILMPLWNDGSLFDSSSKDSDGENKDNDVHAKKVKLIIKRGLMLKTAPKIQSDDLFGANNDMRSLDGVEVDIRNISTTYHVPTTPNTKIHKVHSLDNMIGVECIIYLQEMDMISSC